MVAKPPEEGAAEAAVVKPGFDAGALIVRSEEGKRFRLSWEDAAVKDARRPLPAGAYEVVGYRLSRVSDAGETWHVSATGRKIRVLDLAKGTETRVDVDPTIRVRGRYERGTVGVTVEGERHSGLVVYRAGKRIPIRFRLVATEGEEAGEEKAAGPITYG